MIHFILTVLSVTLLFSRVLPQGNSRTAIPRVVIGIVVENMRPDYVDRFWNRFGNDGFKKLYTQGLVCPNFRMDQLVQGNAPGTATLFTGVTPGLHGIIDNSWYDRSKGIERGCVSDPGCTTIGSLKVSESASPRQLQSSTMADQLKLHSLGKSKVFSVAVNMAPAVISCGFSGDAAYWFDEASGRMVTSSYYLQKLPQWVNDFNGKKLPDSYSSKNWALLKPLSEYRECRADNDTLESGFRTGMNLLPYRMDDLYKTYGDYTALKYTPFANAFLKSFFISLLNEEKIGEDENPDLVTLFFSSMDEMGPSFGPVSMEMEDLYLRLDQEVAEIIQFSEKKYGRENILVYLTSNTSASFPVKYLKEVCRYPAGYFSPESAHALLNTYLNLTFGDMRWIDYVDGSQVYLNHRYAELNKVDLKELRTKAADFLSQFEGIRIAVTADQIRQNQLPENLTNTINQSYSLKRSGDVIYLLQEGWQPVMKNRKINSCNEQDLPLVFFGGGIRSGYDRKSYHATDLVPTLSEILGIQVPPQCRGDIIDIRQGKE
jgi:arylsulfatase A-like enzyme